MGVTDSLPELPDWLRPWSAPAKLNLFLHITGRRQDGYHNLQTLFQILDTGDRLAFDVNQGGLIRRVSPNSGIASDQDLVVRAARLLQQRCHCSRGVDIWLEKRLPMGGGLGGGSSDAATTLCALNMLWGCGLAVDELALLGGQLGADVPVFVRGETAWAEGTGEKLIPVELPPRAYLIVKPAVEVSTAELFSAPELTRNCDPITIRAFLADGGENVFEPLVRARYPEVAGALDWLGKFGNARLTGTGSCVFAALPDGSQAEDIASRLPEGYAGFVARGVTSSPLRREIEELSKQSAYWAVAKR